MSVDKVTTRAKSAKGGWLAQGLQLAGIVLAVFIAKGAIAEPFYVPSGSMEPTLLIGDALLASKFPYGYGTASLPMQINLPETGRVFEARRSAAMSSCSAGRATARRPGSSASSVCRMTASRCGRASSSSTIARPS